MALNWKKGQINALGNALARVFADSGCDDTAGERAYARMLLLACRILLPGILMGPGNACTHRGEREWE